MTCIKHSGSLIFLGFVNRFELMTDWQKSIRTNNSTCKLILTNDSNCKSILTKESTCKSIRNNAVQQFRTNDNIKIRTNAVPPLVL